MASTGVVTQVIGSTFDAQFPEDDIPAIYNAVKIEGETKAGRIDLFGEIAQHLGGGRVRAVALGSTDGVSRGMPCRDTGDSVQVPVGEKVLGRVFNLLGEPIDNRGPVSGTTKRSIHREAPALEQLNPRTEILVTGIKVIDLLSPLRPRRQDRLFGGAGVGALSSSRR